MCPSTGGLHSRDNLIFASFNIASLGNLYDGDIVHAPDVLARRGTAILSCALLAAASAATTNSRYNLADSNEFNTAFKVIKLIGAGFSAGALSDFDNRCGASLPFQGPCGCVDGFVRELVSCEFHGSHFHPKVETLDWFVKNQGCLVYKYNDNWERLALIIVSSSVVDFTPLQHLVKRTEFADNARLVW